ncbi:MAG: hypothetical protein AAF696_07470 [Bacteroidota bacterium]
MKSYGDARSILGWGYMAAMGLLLLSLLIGNNLYVAMMPFDGLSDSQYTFLFLLGWFVISFPFDIVGGYMLPTRYGRSIDSFGEWLGKWIRAAGIQLIYFGLNAWALLGVAELLGIWGGIGWFAFQMILLGNLQVWVARAIAHFPDKPENDRGRLVLYLDNSDKAFTGGIGGLPGNEVLVMPKYWKDKFSEDLLKLLLSRRHGAIQSKSHGRGFLLAFLWNLILFTLAAFLGGLEASTFESLFWTICWFSLFSLLSLLGPLIFMSRKGVFEMDRWVYYKGGDADILRESFEKTYQLRDLPDAKRAMASLTQPLPDRDERLKNMQTQQEIKGAWNAAYLSVFLSWAGVNLLSRSLPVLVGRPEIWVLLPCD